MKRALIMAAACIMLGSCSHNGRDNSENEAVTNEHFGSFYIGICQSYDFKYESTPVFKDNMVGISITDADGKEVFYFEPVRKLDFYGVCWEKDNYNIWVQSGDIGIVCYAYHDGEWTLDKDAVRPGYIKSKYD